jgi:hypothetical protein
LAGAIGRVLVLRYVSRKYANILAMPIKQRESHPRVENNKIGFNTPFRVNVLCGQDWASGGDPSLINNLAARLDVL